MTYQIDAWLERQDPYLRVTDKTTGIPVIDWNAKRLHGLLERGAICPDDFTASDVNQQELVKELFLLSCLEP
ncbi:PA4570 family protein [Marinobacterium arenosum]|uniref:PA4570 family protein n=1 Tax=Marinobacterium arenosum TaxID=2862496 RepID=UPI001C95F42C|nr:hypothetical protein [Marinobacterium arenosum]MBY4678604.1 hypothetical protein [Marinobacterium arenosum]